MGVMVTPGGGPWGDWPHTCCHQSEWRGEGGGGGAAVFSLACLGRSAVTKVTVSGERGGLWWVGGCRSGESFRLLRQCTVWVRGCGCACRGGCVGWGGGCCACAWKPSIGRRWHIGYWQHPCCHQSEWCFVQLCCMRHHLFEHGQGVSSRRREHACTMRETKCWGVESSTGALS